MSLVLKGFFYFNQQGGNMPELVTAEPEGTPEGQGTEETTAQPAEGSEVSTESQESTEVQAGGEPSGEGLPDGFDKPEIAAKMYKDMQKLVSQKDTDLSQYKSQIDQLSQYGGVDGIVKWANYLQANPSFAKWVQDQQQGQNYSALGIDPANVDDETKKALQTVDEISKRNAAQIAGQLYKQNIEPLANTLKDKTLQDHFSQMDTKHEGWREVQDVMRTLSDDLPPQVQDNPSYTDIETLYFKALSQSGKFDDYAAKQYQKRLEKKKGQSIEKPTTASGDKDQPQAKTIQEAAEQAKKQLRR
jgi:hypothetical protein